MSLLMMLSEQAKKGVGVGTPSQGEGPDKDYSFGMESIAESILHAIERRSPSELKSALKSFFSMCEYEEEMRERAEMD